MIAPGGPVYEVDIPAGLPRMDFEEVSPMFMRKMESKSSLAHFVGPGTGSAGERGSRQAVQAITEGNYVMVDSSKQGAAPTLAKMTAPNTRILRRSSAFSPCCLSNDGSEIMTSSTRGYGITWDNGSRQPMFLIVTGVLLLLSTIAVALRLYCRLAIIRYVGLDDKFMLCAWVIAISLGIQNGFLVSWGTGRHNTDLDHSIILVPTFKHCILALYYRIFTQTNFRYAVYAVSILVTIQTIVVTFINAFECGAKEPWRAWVPTFPKGCNDLPSI
ncbi:hypothetical protein OPT61_g3898 [Boeremia exigua]|uniref:Uncharacterized protein n=1 Tax=Boeremia exigua TaxID=749465 RepID=A0ACC2IGF5_9PLEO|nr:hypothetical protein OPT61_g3898 [Boeremia exigua]